MKGGSYGFRLNYYGTSAGLVQIFDGNNNNNYRGFDVDNLNHTCFVYWNQSHISIEIDGNRTVSPLLSTWFDGTWTTAYVGVTAGDCSGLHKLKC